MSAPEQDHIVNAFTFELGKVGYVVIRQRMVDQLQNVDGELAIRVATNLGLTLSPKVANGNPKSDIAPSPALSQTNTAKDSVKTRKIAILTADGVDGQAIMDMNATAAANGASIKIVAPHLGTIRTSTGSSVAVDGTMLTMPSILFDAVLIPGGAASIKILQESGDAVHYALETYVHYKPLAATGEGADFLAHVGLISKNRNLPLPEGVLTAPGTGMTDDFRQQFINAIGQHRFFTRERVNAIPA